MNQIKKILIFSVAYYPKFVGGAEVAVKEITDRINKDKYEFHLITLRLDKNLPREEKFGNVYIHRIGFVGVLKDSADSLKFPLHYNKYLFPFISLWKGLLLNRKHKFDFVWSIMANYSGFGALFFKLLNPNIKFVLTLQEGDPIDYIKKRVGIFYPIFKMIFKKADTVQAISNYLADFGKEMGFRGVPYVIPNGVDMKKFDTQISKEDKNIIRQKFNINDKDILLVTTSRLVVKNGIGDVINSLPNLPSNLKFLICGEGYLKESLEDQAIRLDVSNRCIFVGYVDHNDMPKLLKSSDIFIRPSLSEGFGNSFIEAMACNIPVVATPVGGIVDFLIDGKTGYFCKPNDPKNIADTVTRVINDENKDLIVQDAYNMVKDKYNWEIVTSQINEIFDNIKTY